MQPAARFICVDTASGDVDRRNVIKTVDEVNGFGETEQYASWQRGTQYLRTWVENHTNDCGNPTVKGFDGPTWAPALVLDFDHRTDAGQALVWLRDMLLRLGNRGVDPAALRLYFSGKKGFHLEIPAALFGGFEPSEQLHRQLKRAAELLMKGTPFDSSIYDKLRLLRLENSRHGQTNLFKIRLTAHEALTLTIGEIRALAAHPRPTESIPGLGPIPDDDWPPVPALVELWEEAKRTAERPSRERRAGVVTDDARDRQTVAAIAGGWPRGGPNAAGLSRHTDYLMPIAGFLSGRTSEDHAIRLLSEGAREASDPTFLTGRDWEFEIERLAEGSADRREGGKAFTGLPTLSERSPALANVLGALWPVPALDREHGADRSASEQAPPRPGAGWPDPLAEEAYHGLAGRIVRAIEPHTEADPVALLIQLLVAVGNAINRAPHFMAEADRHDLNEDAVLVGASAKGRKGTSWGYIRRILRDVDPAWTYDRVSSGLSSGEGLIWQVRDKITKQEAVKENGKPTGEYREEVVDPGVADKRLLVLESEFASTLRVIGREGNTLSAIIRQAWDTGCLRSLTKNSPAKATDAHISIIGHITRDELRRFLDSTEAGNGFGNRFLWLAVRRSKVLPEGGRFHEVDLDPLIRELREAVDFARRTGELHRDDEARAIWARVYPELSEGKPGLLGAIIARGEAHVMRFACIYAVLDRSQLVEREHLLAALALWDYAEASARWIFGEVLGDPVADEILKALRGRPDGMTRTEISGLFARHQSAGQIGRALDMLAERGLGRSVKEQPDSGDGSGRRPERWFAA